jgi:phosphoribosylglycinamide formyltransferase-1
MRFLRIGVLVSGNGSVLRTLLRACGEGVISGEVAAVASNVSCPALKVGKDGGVPMVSAFEIDRYASRWERDAAIARALVDQGVDFVVVGGYSEVLEPGFFEIAPPEVISMYPAALPAFGELDEAIGPALEYGVKTVAVTIHFRTPLSLSGGPIIAQEPLPVGLDDTVKAVTSRVIDLESRLLPRVVQAFAEGRVARDGGRVRVLERAT